MTRCITESKAGIICGTRDGSFRSCLSFNCIPTVVLDRAQTSEPHWRRTMLAIILYGLKVWVSFSPFTPYVRHVKLYLPFYFLPRCSTITVVPLPPSKQSLSGNSLTTAWRCFHGIFLSATTIQAPSVGYKEETFRSVGACQICGYSSNRTMGFGCPVFW